MMFLLSGFGIFFSILLLFYNRGYRSANLFLGLFLILFNFVTLSHFIYVFSDSKVTVAFFLSIPLNASSYLIGPLAFFYVRSILKDDSYFTKYDWLHFILFAIIFLGRLPFNLSDWNDKLLIAEDIIFNSRNGLSYPDLNNFLTMNINYKMKGIHFIIYLIIIWYNLLKSKTKSRFLLTTSRQEKIVITWLIFFVTIISFLGVFFILILFPNADIIVYQSEIEIPFLLVFVGFLMLILGLILFPQILYGVPLEKRVVINNNNETKAINETEKLSLHDDYIDKIRLLLQTWVLESKFTDSNSTLNSLSVDIGIPFHHLSYYFNHINNEKYIDWRNRLRVEYALKLLLSEQGFEKTFEVLSQESGFRSYSAFIRCFKQFTGKLPKEFVKDSKS